MIEEVNPFQELYVTDSPDPKVFVQLFSDRPVAHAQALFRPGNVVLKGTQGSGKSMLLNLFRPQIRLAYHEAGITFPVHPQMAEFVGAGINLTRSGALDIGQRSLGVAGEEELFPLYFADFVNYFVVRDLMETILTISRNSAVFGDLVHENKLNECAIQMASEDCWFGALASCGTIVDVCRRLDERIGSYRDFHNSNAELPPVIHRTKTAIGEPIARTADCLKRSGVLDASVPVFIRIDQVERLCRSDALRPSLGRQYRRMVNKALSTRDQRISYRIGTRRYAWDDDLTVFGTNDKLEHLRDYRIIDLDVTLRRKEDQKTWVFPDFAYDAFKRRLRHSGYDVSGKRDLLKAVFGPSLSPEKIAKEYAGNSTPERALLMPSEWPTAYKRELAALFVKSPLEAALAAAWLRQGRRHNGHDQRDFPAFPQDRGPWQRTYWRKERVRVALMQLAARSAQRMKWSGKDQVLSLSSGNISIFLSICHEVWEAFLRYQRRDGEPNKHDPIKEGIDPTIQAVGIHTASTEWYEKITEQPNGDDRQRFVDVLGRLFRRLLLDDAALSYPGQNGFSVADDDLRTQAVLASFLAAAVDYGDLCDAPHTTKTRDRRQRRKWYLNPILSPFFQLPESHVKEPYYASVDDLMSWASDAHLCLPGCENAPKRAVRKKRPMESDTGAPMLPLFPQLKESK